MPPTSAPHQQKRRESSGEKKQDQVNPQGLAGRCRPGSSNRTTDGPIFLIEPTDNPNDLPQMGLPRDSGGLLGSRPEAVHRMTLQDGSVAYRVILIQNDEYSPTVFLRSGQLAPEGEGWLETEGHLSASSMNNSQIERLPDRTGRRFHFQGGERGHCPR